MVFEMSRFLASSISRLTWSDNRAKSSSRTPSSLCGVSVTASLLRELLKVRDFAVAIRNGTIDRRGTVFGSWHYRVQGDHLVLSQKKHRIEFNFIHPHAFSAYLL